MAESNTITWKEEPLSPPLFTEENWWLNASDNVAIEVELGDGVLSRAEAASQLLETLDHWVEQEEQFPTWCEERMDLPIFEDLPTPALINSNMDVASLKPSPSPVYLDPITLKSTHTTHTTLGDKPQLITLKTPAAASNVQLKVPQVMGKVEVVGVKHQNQNIMQMSSLLQVPAAVPIALLQNQLIPQTQMFMQEFDYPPLNNTNHETLTPPESPKESELQMLTMLQGMQDEELDELVRMRVESMVETPQPSGDNSRSSLTEESESVASPSSDSGYSDPDWTVPSFSELKAPKKKRSAKPYIRVAPEEKRLRKKEQNKNAATRYRIKKKQEIEEIMGEEKSLKDKQEQLKSELVDVKREIKYLKNLMRDVFKAKGLIK